MNAEVEQSSVAFDTYGQYPKVTGERGTASVIHPWGGFANVYRWENFHRPPYVPLLRTWGAHQITSPLIDSACNFQDFIYVNSAVFTTADAAVLSHFKDSSTSFAPEPRVQSKINAYLARIESLCIDAAEDGYGLNSKSEDDFWKFIRSDFRIRKGQLVLVDNGNLRVIWKDEIGTHLGLQFLGDQMVQYVIFKRCEATLPISRVAGRDSFVGLKKQIDAFELRSLLYE